MNNKDRINTCEFFDICEAACGGTLEDTEICNCYGLFKQLKRKEQTLINIKEIVKSFCNACKEFEPEKVKNCMYCNYDKILQKINECEVK